MSTGRTLDLAIVGAGPAGLAAAVRARRLGLKDLVVFDRDERPGGILHQCIHPGFGLVRFGEELTGPEYAWRFIREAESLGVPIELDTTVIEVDRDRVLTVAGPAGGVRRYRCRSIILAMGCRERTRAGVRLPGTRPAGICTAGRAQRLVNIEGCLPGREVVIVGSGDIGMIMARRLALEGCRIHAVVEINPYTSGLIRNEVQCLRDFGIPLRLGHVVTEILGENRVEGVRLAAVDEAGRPVPGTERTVACDTLLLSVGLIPENELSRMAGIPLDAATGGPVVDNLLETSREGVFACGNVLHVNDLVDEVSLEGEIAAEGAAARLSGRLPERSAPLDLVPGNNIAQVVPQRVLYARDTRLAVRVRRPTGPVSVRIGQAVRGRFPLTRPGEMIELSLDADRVREMAGGNAAGNGEREVRIECE